jgi:hypothetical protein
MSERGDQLRKISRGAFTLFGALSFFTRLGLIIHTT